MRRVATVEVWGRRRELVTPLLGLVAAIAAVVFWILGEPVPAAVSLFAGLVAAAVTVVIELRLGAARKRREEVVLGGQVRADFQPVDEVDPTDVGVDPAAMEEMGLDGDIPDYMPRDADARLEDALCKALDKTGKWIVVVYGPSKVGKSRTLFEGLRRLYAEGEDLRLIAPTDGKALRALLEQVKVGRKEPERLRHVLWLDDLENFVAEDVGWPELQAWRRKGAVVVATFGGKGSERDFGEKTEWISDLAENVMLRAARIGLQATTSEELRQLPASLSLMDQKAIADYGLAAALVAAAALDIRLKSQHRLGEPKSPAGAAVVYTAINWARCGRTDPIPKQTLHELWPDHLAGEGPKTDKAFEKGLAWALKPVAGSVSLLRGEDSFRAYDYVRSSAVKDPDAPQASERTWQRALDTEDPGQAFGVGVAAHAAKRLQDAEKALTLASSSEDSEIASVASYNLGLLLRERKNFSGAEEAFSRAAELGSPAAVGKLGRSAVAEAMEEVEGPDESVRVAIEEQLRSDGLLTDDANMMWGEEVYRWEVERGNGEAAADLGLALMGREELQEAEQMFRKAIELGVAPAWSYLGVLLEEMDDIVGAEGAYREAVKHDLPDGAFNLGLLLKDKGDLTGSEEALRKAVQLGHGPAASNLGVLLEQRGDLAGAEAAYRQAMERGVANGAMGLGSLLKERGEMGEAESCFRFAATQGHMAGAVALARLLVERGEMEAARDAFRPSAAADGTDDALLFGVLLNEMGDFDGAEAAYREAMGKGIAVAAFELGRLLEARGRVDEAEEAYVTAERLEEAEWERQRRREREEEQELGE